MRLGGGLLRLASRPAQRRRAPVMLPSAALMPPCAATVWLRVGNSLVMHLRQQQRQQGSVCWRACVQQPGTGSSFGIGARAATCLPLTLC